MYGVEVHSPIIAMLVCIEVAAPEVQELEDRSKAELLEQVEDVFPSRSLSESLAKLFQFWSV